MKNTVKRFIAFVLCLGMFVCMCACSKTKPNTNSDGETVNDKNYTPDLNDTSDSNKTEDNYTVKVMALKGPTGMGMSYLMDGKGDGSYNIKLASAPDEVVSAFTSGSIDVAAVPINLAATLYNKLEGDVQMLAINTLGVLYIIENGETVKNIGDLAGKTIHVTGQASTPEYILNYLLKKNGLEDVKVEYHTDHSELATLMASGNVKLGMLPEPNVTAAMAKNADLRIALNLTEEWNKVADEGSALAQGCVIARKSFVDEKKSSIDIMLNDLIKSVAFVNDNIEEAAKSIADNGILPSEAIAKKAIPNCNIVCITGTEMKQVASGMFDILFESDPKSVGGKVPDGSFYRSEDII